MAKAKDVDAPEEVIVADEQPAEPVIPVAEKKWTLIREWAGTHRETPCASSDGKTVCELVLNAMAKIDQGFPTLIQPDLEGELTKARLVREENENQE
jgi:hypothetical protein